MRFPPFWGGRIRGIARDSPASRIGISGRVLPCAVAWPSFVRATRHAAAWPGAEPKATQAASTEEARRSNGQVVRKMTASRAAPAHGPREHLGTSSSSYTTWAMPISIGAAMNSFPGTKAPSANNSPTAHKRRMGASACLIPPGYCPRQSRAAAWHNPCAQSLPRSRCAPTIRRRRRTAATTESLISLSAGASCLTTATERNPTNLAILTIPNGCFQPNNLMLPRRSTRRAGLVSPRRLLVTANYCRLSFETTGKPRALRRPCFAATCVSQNRSGDANSAIAHVSIPMAPPMSIFLMASLYR